MLLLEDYNDLVAMVSGSGVLTLPVPGVGLVRGGGRVPAAADWCEGVRGDGSESFEAAAGV